MSLKILKAGVLDSVQDMGRYGFQYLGVNPTGAMDRYAASVANILAGNPPEEAVIECHFPGPSILFEKTAIIALAGADFAARANGIPVPVNHPIILESGTQLEFSSVISGSRVYIAVSGGLKLEKWLGSFSTNLKAQTGGFQGRRLGKDDMISFRKQAGSLRTFRDKGIRILPWKINNEWDRPLTDRVWVLPGSEWDWLDEPGREKFLKNVFYITAQSDRMGYRLASEPLRTNGSDELVSSAVNFGTIQLLPDGQLIILMADHQTAGGYPRIAHVISTQLSQLAQMRAGDELRFSFTDHWAAEQLILRQTQHLRQLQNACTIKLQNFLLENN